MEKTPLMAFMAIGVLLVSSINYIYFWYKLETLPDTLTYTNKWHRINDSKTISYPMAISAIIFFGLSGYRFENPIHQLATNILILLLSGLGILLLFISVFGYALGMSSKNTERNGSVFLVFVWCAIMIYFSMQMIWSI